MAPASAHIVRDRNGVPIAPQRGCEAFYRILTRRGSIER